MGCLCKMLIDVELTAKRNTNYRTRQLLLKPKYAPQQRKNPLMLITIVLHKHAPVALTWRPFSSQHFTSSLLEHTLDSQKSEIASLWEI